MLRFLLFSLIAGLAAAEIPAPGLYLSDFHAAAKVQWPKNRILTIAVHGHSVPAGYFQTPEVRTLSAYPHRLRVALANAYPYATINVIVTAIGGENSEQGAARFERDVLSLRPDVVTIDYALNDRKIGLARAAVAWRAMIDGARGRGVRVILLTPSPDTGGDASVLEQHEKQIFNLAMEYSVGLAHAAAAFTHASIGTNDLMAQPNHPNWAGHWLIARELAQWFVAPTSSGLTLH